MRFMWKIVRIFYIIWIVYIVSMGTGTDICKIWGYNSSEFVQNEIFYYF